MTKLLNADIEVLNDAVTAMRCAKNEITRLADTVDRRECRVTMRTLDDAIAACERMAGVQLPHCTNPHKAPQVQPTGAELEMMRSNKPAGDYECEVSRDSRRHSILAYWNGSTLHWGREHMRISASCNPKVLSGPLVRLPMQWLESVCRSERQPEDSQ